MKNFTLSLLFTLLIAINYSQHTFSFQQEIIDDCHTTEMDDHLTTNHQLKTGDTIWSEDFGNGFPSGWTIQDLSGICPWVWSNDGSWGYFNTNNGTSAGTGINSSTASNGFLICDTDSANNTNYGQPSGSNYQYLESYFTTNSIDLSGYPAVVLEFQQFFRYNNGIDMKVMVSTNNVTWTTYTVQGNSSNNTASDNPEIIKLNISAVAGNQPNVYIKIGWNARVYYWMIDDMKILEADPNDLALKTTYFETLGLPYYMIPTTQLTDINFSATTINNGANDQTGSKLSIDINSTNVGASDSTTIASGGSDSLYLNQGYTPSSSVGSYTLKWTVSSDSIDDTPMDNSKTIDIEVTDYIYARDNNIKDGNRYNSGDPYEVGSLFDIITTQDIYGVDFVVDDASEPGAIVYGVIYSIDAASGDFIFETNTDDYSLTSNDINNELTITLPFFSSMQLTAGKTYLIMVGAYGDGGSTNDLVVRTAGVSPPQTSFKYDGADLTWYYTTKTPMVRMNFDPSIGNNAINEINTASFQLMQNSPNPANNETSIRFNLNRKGICHFELSTVSGKIIYSQNLGIQSAGLNNIHLNTSKLSKGIYFYTLAVENTKQTKKLIIE